MSLLIGALTIGLILSLLALGMFISFKIYNFADITAEGSITLGASIAAALIVSGMNPVSATLIAMAGGFIAGTLTGIIHTKFNINGLLAGILMMTALYSVNLHIMGKSNLPLMSQKTLISIAGDISFIPDNDTAVLVVILAFVALIGIALYLFFRTNLGTAKRATGNNPQMIRALGVNTGLMITLGLGMANALIALSGAILAQYQGFADVSMGIGMIVAGLASVIIGQAIIGRLTVFRAATAQTVDADLLAEIDQCFGLSGAVDAIVYHDARRGIDKKAVTVDGTLFGVRLAGETLAQSWLKAAMAEDALDSSLMRFVLAPSAKPPVAVAARNIVCKCADISDTQIQAELAAGADLGKLQDKLKCGTFCGGCLPDIKRMVAEYGAPQTVAA